MNKSDQSHIARPDAFAWFVGFCSLFFVVFFFSGSSVTSATQVFHVAEAVVILGGLWLLLRYLLLLFWPVLRRLSRLGVFLASLAIAAPLMIGWSFYSHSLCQALAFSPALSDNVVGLSQFLLAFEVCWPFERLYGRRADREPDRAAE